MIQVSIDYRIVYIYVHSGAIFNLFFSDYKVVYIYVRSGAIFILFFSSWYLYVLGTFDPLRLFRAFTTYVSCHTFWKWLFMTVVISIVTFESYYSSKAEIRRKHGF